MKGEKKNPSPTLCPVMHVACDVLFLLSSGRQPLQLSAIIATKAATISIAMGHLQDHLKAPSRRLCLKMMSR